MCLSVSYTNILLGLSSFHQSRRLKNRSYSSSSHSVCSAEKVWCQCLVSRWMKGWAHRQRPHQESDFYTLVLLCLAFLSLTCYSVRFQNRPTSCHWPTFLRIKLSKQVLTGVCYFTCTKALFTLALLAAFAQNTSIKEKNIVSLLIFQWWLIRVGVAGNASQPLSTLEVLSKR